MTVTTFYSPLTDTPVPTLPKGPVDIPADNRALVEKLETYTIPRFATIAQRDAKIPSPTAGQVCYVTEADSLYKSTGANWVRLSQDNDQRGRCLAVLTNATDASSKTTGSWEQLVPAPGTAGTVSIPNNVSSERFLRVTALIQLGVSVVSETSVWFYMDGALMGGPDRWRVTNPTIDAGYLTQISLCVPMPSPGSHTFQVRALNGSGQTGTGWSFYWGQLIVEIV